MELLLIGLVVLAALAGGKKKAADAGFKDQPDTQNGDAKKKAVVVVPDHGKAAGDPPNISEDPAGYNTQRWPSTQAACTGGGALGYAFFADCNDPQLTSNFQFSKNAVKQFQRDYNKIALHPGWGGIRGSLTVDGIVGKNTFNAMEAAEMMGFPWQAIVAGMPPP